MTSQLLIVARQLRELGLTAASLYIADLLGKGVLTVQEYSEALRQLKRKR